MYKKVTSNGFNLRNHLQIAKALFVFINLFILTVYASLLLMFNEFPLNVAEESFFVLSMLGIGTGVAFALSFANLLGDALYCYIRQSSPSPQPSPVSLGLA